MTVKVGNHVQNGAVGTTMPVVVMATIIGEEVVVVEEEALVATVMIAVAAAVATVIAEVVVTATTVVVEAIAVEMAADQVLARERLGVGEVAEEEEEVEEAMNMIEEKTAVETGEIREVATMTNAAVEIGEVPEVATMTPVSIGVEAEEAASTTKATLVLPANALVYSSNNEEHLEVPRMTTQRNQIEVLRLQWRRLQMKTQALSRTSRYSMLRKAQKSTQPMNRKVRNRPMMLGRKNVKLKSENLPS